MSGNINAPSWDADMDDQPFHWRRAKLGQQAGGERLGASVYELGPGAATYPLHFHHRNEEMIIVLQGRPTLKTLEGDRKLEEGELVSCPVGPRGAHRLDNDGDDVARVLIISTQDGPETVEMPEDGKVYIFGTPESGVEDRALDLE